MLWNPSFKLWTVKYIGNKINAIIWWRNSRASAAYLLVRVETLKHLPIIHMSGEVYKCLHNIT
jgi:hypothetical protein